jgi:hypothetical protein
MDFLYLCGMSKLWKVSQGELWRKLIEAPASERPTMFRQVSRRGRRPNVQVEFEGWTLLHLAVHQGWINEVQWLLEAGANPFLKNQREESPLELAVRMGYLEIAKILLINMLEKGKEYPGYYRLLLRELADWYFLYKTTISFGQGEAEEPKQIRYKRRRRQKRAVEMILRVFKEIFTEVSEEELNKRGFPTQVGSRLRWDPLWGRKGFGKSPLTYFFKKELPCQKEFCAGKYCSMRCKSVLQLFCSTMDLLFLLDELPELVLKLIDGCSFKNSDPEWRVEYFFLHQVMELPLYFQKKIKNEYGDYLDEAEDKREEILRCFEKSIEITLRDEEQPLSYGGKAHRRWYKESLCTIIDIDKFYLPPEGERLSEELYQRAMATLRGAIGGDDRRCSKKNEAVEHS